MPFIKCMQQVSEAVHMACKIAHFISVNSDVLLLLLLFLLLLYVLSLTQCCTADRRGELVRAGVKVAIVGSPNVGKSSILNYLANRKAAIVSAIPGTTRDAIEINLDIGGYKVSHYHHSDFSL